MLRSNIARGLLIVRRAAACAPRHRRVSVNVVRQTALATGRCFQLVTFPTHLQRASTRIHAIRCYSSKLPPHTKVVLPALSPTMEEGSVVSWAKKEGDKLNEGDLLAEIETDKATMAFETPEEGYLAKILVPAGTKGVPIGRLVCIIVENQEDVAVFKDFKDDAPVSAAKKPDAPVAPLPPAPTPAPPAPAPQAPPPAAPKPAPAPAAPAAADDQQGTRVYASPMAKRLAEQRQIRLQGKGTGLFGSITSSDLDKMPAGGAQPAAAAPAPAPPKAPAPTVQPGENPFIDIPNSNIRATIAKRLTQSKSSIPHFYVSGEVCLNTIQGIRQKLNKKLENQGVRLSVNDFVVKAAAMANLKVPEVNSSWMETCIRQYLNVDVSIAVATDTGLITPIVFEANRKGILEISKEIKSLAKRARENKLQPQEFMGGTFTISNLGMFDVTFFTAIINPPQSCILAVGTGKDKLVDDENAPKGYRKLSMMQVALSCDHRVVDGAVAARWLKAFRQNMEDPIWMSL